MDLHTSELILNELKWGGGGTYIRTNNQTQWRGRIYEQTNKLKGAGRTYKQTNKLKEGIYIQTKKQTQKGGRTCKRRNNNW